MTLLFLIFIEHCHGSNKNQSRLWIFQSKKANLLLFTLWAKTHSLHKNVQPPPRANRELGSLWHVRSGGAHFVIAPVPGGRRMRLNLLFIASILKRSRPSSLPLLASYSRMTDFLILYIYQWRAWK
jgi:hypothetical protein